MSRSLLKLAISLVLTGAALITLTLLNPSRFTSIDSSYYLQSAACLLNGRGYIVMEEGKWGWNGTFPIGYSALIAGCSGLTGIPILWTSKLVNLLALVASTVLWQRRLGTQRVLWLVSIWWLGSFVRIIVYTWSETVFLMLLAEWVWRLTSFLKLPTVYQGVQLALLGFGLFLLRYVGGYVAGFLALLALALYLAPHRTQSLLSLKVSSTTRAYLLTIMAFSLLGMGAYGWLNQQLSGSLYGGERFTSTESAGSLLSLFVLSIGNELFLIRDFLPNSDNSLAWIGLTVQLIWLLLLYRQFRRKSRSESKPHSSSPLSGTPTLVTLSRIFALVGLLYLLVLICLRIVSPFSGPNARLMAPTTFCLLMALMIQIGTKDRTWQRTLRPYWIGLLICSWLQLLPQVNFSAKMTQVRSRIFATY